VTASHGCDAVLFDRDGTLIVDVPYNGDPRRVLPVPGARRALDLLRDRGIAIGVVTNQSGVARGVLTIEDVWAVNQRVEQLLGPFDTWQVCPHGAHDGCRCRKPEPGLVLAASSSLGVPTHRMTLIGDIGSDVSAGLAANARAILVPTPKTRREEVDAAPEVSPDLLAAVEKVLR
jgi:D-glycero-D-manno-heptose 1,7-bisphosphate phosphatase